MTKRFSTLKIAALSLGLVLVSVPVFAQTIDWTKSTGLDETAKKAGLTSYCQGLNNCAVTIAGNIINAALGLIGIVLLGYFLYAGFLWMTAGGDEKKVGEAKSMIKNAVAGLVIIVASYAIASFVISALSGALDSAGGGGGGGGGAVPAAPNGGGGGGPNVPPKGQGGQVGP